MKGRLLACTCAVGLLAAPAFAATDSSSPMGTSPGADTTMQHHPMHRTMHPGRTWRQTDTSQNSAIDQLNEQSLAAARQNRPFEPGGSAGGSMGGGSGMSGSPGMGSTDTTSGGTGSRM